MKQPGILPDIQLWRDSRGIEVDQAGVKAVMMPLRILRPDGGLIVTPASCTLSVNLAAELRGVHMSRFVALLAEFSSRPLADLCIRPLLDQTLVSLQSLTAAASIEFHYFMDKKAPISGESAPMGYACTLLGSLDAKSSKQECDTFLRIRVPVSNLCPCSKAISEGGAHSQRSEITAQLRLDEAQKHDFLWLEDTVLALEAVSSAPVYPILKRVDEKDVTDRQYENPKFVEDIVRDAALALKRARGIDGFRVEVEAYESIHAHNAWASVVAKGRA